MFEVGQVCPRNYIVRRIRILLLSGIHSMEKTE